MPETDWSIVSTVMSCITAVVAVVAPVVSSIVSVKAQERMKKNEVYMPRVYDALAEVSLKYSRLIRKSTACDNEAMHAEYLEALNRYHEFAAACYTLMSLVPGEGIQQQIAELLACFDGSLSPYAKHDKMFYQLMNDINDYLRTSKIKKPKQQTKEHV